MESEFNVEMMWAVRIWRHLGSTIIQSNVIRALNDGHFSNPVKCRGNRGLSLVWVGFDMQEDLV